MKQTLLVISMAMCFLSFGCENGSVSTPETNYWTGDWELSLHEVSNTCECFMSTGRPFTRSVKIIQSESDITVCAGIRCLVWLFSGTATENRCIVANQPYPIQRDCNKNLVEGSITLEFIARTPSKADVSMHIRANNSISGEACRSDFTGDALRN